MERFGTISAHVRSMSRPLRPHAPEVGRLSGHCPLAILRSSYAVASRVGSRGKKPLKGNCLCQRRQSSCAASPLPFWALVLPRRMPRRRTLPPSTPIMASACPERRPRHPRLVADFPWSSRPFPWPAPPSIPGSRAAQSAGPPPPDLAARRRLMAITTIPARTCRRRRPVRSKAAWSPSRSAVIRRERRAPSFPLPPHPPRRLRRSRLRRSTRHRGRRSLFRSRDSPSHCVQRRPLLRR